MNNEVFGKAMRLLAHPATVAALALLFLNDHLFRRLWPSWWTGKLGDFAWLFFMPFVAAVCIALLAGRHARNRWVGALACLSVGGVFALAKAIPAAHTAVVTAASALFGFPVAWRRDPTDLIALTSVAVAWWFWQRTPLAAPPQIVARPARAWVLLVLAGLLTVANAPAPERGIVGVVPKDGLLIACASRSEYVSADGGLTWTQLLPPTPVPHPTLPPDVTPTAGPTLTPLPTSTPEPGAPTPIPYELGDVCDLVYRGDESIVQAQRIGPIEPTPTDSPTPAPGEEQPTPGPTATPPIYLMRDRSDNVRYLFQPGNWIARSEDGGATWKAEYAFAADPGKESGEEEYFSIKSFIEAVFSILASPGDILASRSEIRVSGPLAGMIDPASGNVIFSMGLQGVLVRDTGGNYVWASVGGFER